MTSIAIISGAVARIEHLKEEAAGSLANEAEELVQGLKKIKEGLITGYDEKREEAEMFGMSEKEVVRLCYEIIDALADVSSKSKERWSLTWKLMAWRDWILTWRDWIRGRVNLELGDLKQKLEDLQKSLDEESQRAYSASPSVVIDIQQEADNKEENQETVEVLVDRLRKELSDQSDNTSSLVVIQGKSGMGKTTLAKKLFADHQLKEKFEVFAWVSINHNFQIKRVLQVLLQQLGSRKKEDIRHMKEIELIGEIFAVLEKKNYLLVLDDMGAAVEEWQSIRLALPIATSSKVIITTSSDQLDGVAAQTKASVYKVPGIIQSDILAILNQTTSFDPNSNVAKAISDVAGGSPLIAILVGKCLRAEADIASNEQQLVRELQSYIPHKGTPQVLKECYKRLAHEIKPCFLYLGLFPQGQDVDVEKLYMLLEAEDLIMSSKRDVLEVLAGMKLVEVQEDIVRKSGIYKSCRLQDQVDEFCKWKGSKEEFFEIVDFESKKEVGPNTRRLAIYLSNYKDDKSNPLTCSQETLKKIWSLLIFDAFESESKSRWPSEINDLKEFNRLCILNFDGVDFRIRKCPKGFDKLRLLRYLSFRGCWLEELPSSLSKLIHLETLDLLVHADCKMHIPNNILTNMKEMLHLYFPRLYACDGKSKLQLQGLERLETLVNFDTEACDVASLSQFKKLKILTAILKGQESFQLLVDNREDNGILPQLSVDIRNFQRYSKDSVSNLKKFLEWHLLHSIHIEGQIGELKVEDGLAPQVAEIILSGSEIERDPMKVLGRFQNLRSLVLKNDAVVTSDIVISAASNFPKLRSLKLHNLQYPTKLTIEVGAMPELSTLEIESCPLLQDLSIPQDVQNRLNRAQGDIGLNTYSVL